ncbi:MAG: hypothetical protein KDI75_03000 [Xanthomonadales bacterium]|nr:hypothetical protein [Xanthomonadales bacterium]
MHARPAMSASARSWTVLAALFLCLWLTACAGGGSTDVSGATVSASEKAQAPSTDTTRIEIDYSCNSNDQCVIKDIGSCCGYRPACVNIDSPTDPATVKAACEREGTASICGFPAISACQCVESRCQPTGNPSLPAPVMGNQ